MRFHTRVPVVEPERVDAGLIAALRSSGKATMWRFMPTIRGNSPPRRARRPRLIDAGIVMVSQSVLLKGVNDDPDVLAALMRAFVETRIKPYYLHHPDLAPAPAISGCPSRRARLSSPRCVDASRPLPPPYILDIPGGYGKGHRQRQRDRGGRRGCYNGHRLPREQARLSAEG